MTSDGRPIAPDTTVGAVHLTVGDLERSLVYYRQAVGLNVLERDRGRASLGAGGRELVVLAELAGARPALGHTGLYHLALLVPERQDLARSVAHAARDRVPLQGLADHFVSEAIYLSDPDAHGIEICWDRPRELWQGRVAERMTTLPLDVDDLLAELGDTASEPFPGLPERTRMGHVHLRVAGIQDSVEFYRDVLGFELTAALGSQAAFLGAGGYHHHVGANTWESRRRRTAARGGRAAPRHDRLPRRGRARPDPRARRRRRAGAGAAPGGTARARSLRKRAAHGPGLSRLGSALPWC